MIRKSLLYVVVGVIAIAITACGGKGLDRKLNYSASTTELIESYNKAVIEAQPAQQNILRKHEFYETITSVLTLKELSNPMVFDAFQAKNSAHEFERLSNMTVRELFVWNSENIKGSLNSAIKTISKFQKEAPVHVESVTIEKAGCRSQTLPCNSDYIIGGSVSLRNNGDTDVELRRCKAEFYLDDKQIGGTILLEKEGGMGSCSGKLKSKAEATAFPFFTTLSDVDKDDPTFLTDSKTISHIHDLIKIDNVTAITWRITPVYSIDLTTGNWYTTIGIDDESMSEYKAQLEDISADLALMSGINGVRLD